MQVIQHGLAVKKTFQYRNDITRQLHKSDPIYATVSQEQNSRTQASESRAFPVTCLTNLSQDMLLPGLNSFSWRN